MFVSKQFLPDSQRFPSHRLRFREPSFLPIHAAQIIQRSSHIGILAAEELPPNGERFAVYSFRLGHLVLGDKRQTQFVKRRSGLWTFRAE